MKIKLFALALTVVLFTGCLGSPPSGGTAEVALYMTASENSTSTMGFETVALDEEITEIWVTIEAVTAKLNNKWVKLLDVPMSEGKINLMNLQLKQKLLGTANIPAGKYSEIRFELSGLEQNNYIVFASGRTAALKVPSNELKPEFQLVIAKDTMAELVFDINQDFLVELGSDGVYNVNPRKALRFVGSFDNLYGSLQGEVVLPDGIEQLLSIQVHLFRLGKHDPIWTTSLQDSKLKFEISTLPAGEYWLEAEVRFLDLASLDLRTDQFRIETGKCKEVALRHYFN